MEEDKNAFKMLTGKPTVKPRDRWEDLLFICFRRDVKIMKNGQY